MDDGIVRVRREGHDGDGFASIHRFILIGLIRPAATLLADASRFESINRTLLFSSIKSCANKVPARPWPTIIKSNFLFNDN